MKPENAPVPQPERGRTFLQRVVNTLRPGRRSVRGKLVGMVLLITVVTLLVSGFAILAHDVYVNRAAWAADMDTEAGILALSTAPALAFDDRVVAARNLAALEARPSVLAAAVYTPDGQLYARHVRRGETPPPESGPPLAEGVRIQGESVEVARRVMYEDEVLGTIYLRGRYDVAGRAAAYLGIFAFVTALSLVLALFVSTSLQRTITEPLEAIAEVARKIVHRRDYSLRVERTTNDEIGIVVRGLNNMLQEVQLRTQELEETNASLQEEIAERRIAEKSRHESEMVYRAIGESIAYGVWRSDPEGRNTYASDSFLRLTGMTQEQCSAFGWADLLHPDDAQATMAAWQECVAGRYAWYREHRIRGGDGQYHAVLAQGLPIHNEAGEVTGWAGINLDIGRMKRTEEALRQADRRKDEFLATLAHELRNPLAPIRHATEVLGSSVSSDAQREWARRVIARQVQHMALLLDDLLDVSRITRARLEIKREHVPLADLVAAAVEATRPMIEQREHRLEVRLPEGAVVLDVDPLRLSQALSNLLTNAAKYTDAGGRILLEAALVDDGVSIRVADNGIGLAPESIGVVFEMFSQVESALNRSQGGLGIGLALVRGFVRLHGGTVEATSQGIGHGSTFTLRLPASCVVQAARAAPAPVTGAATPGAPPCTVLVADDNRDAADSMAVLLRFLDYQVEVAYSGRAALQAALESRPTAVILDIGMPELSGYEIARRIREEPWGRAVVLVAVTGWSQQDDVDRAKSAGFDRHFCKPVQVDELHAALQLLVGAKRGAPEV